MGQKGSSSQVKTPLEICSNLNLTSSSYYSNYHGGSRKEDISQRNCCFSLNCCKKEYPIWLKYFHTKCQKMEPSKLSWAEQGKILEEMITTRDFQEEYRFLFEKKLKETKSILSTRNIENKQEDEHNLANVLDGINETMQQQPLQQQEEGRRLLKQQDNNILEQQQQYQEQNKQNPNLPQKNAANTSFPSYMVESEFQELRAGNLTIMKLQEDPEMVKKNLLIYFECTTLITSHLEDDNFTLNFIRRIFISSFTQRYSQELKNFKNIQKQQSANNDGFSQQQTPHEAINNNQDSLESESNDFKREKVGSNEGDFRIGIDELSSLRFSREEKYLPNKQGMSVFQNALSEFEYFVKIYMETIKQYYGIHYRKNTRVNQALRDLFSYKNFQNFVISKLFENDKFPKMLLEILKLTTPDDSQLIQSIDVQDISPYLFGVPPAFSLDQDTLRSLRIFNNPIKEEPDNFQNSGLLNQNKQESKKDCGEQGVHNNPNNIHNDEDNNNPENDIESDENQDMVFELRVPSKNIQQLDAEFQQSLHLRNSHASLPSNENLLQKFKGLNTNTPNPYQRCIDCIYKMVESSTPTGKFKQIILVCEGIEKCIKQFYQSNGKSFKYHLNEDNIVSILTYIIAQAKVPNLEAHCNFVKAFYKSPTKKLKLRYYLLAFEVGLRNVHQIFSQRETYDSLQQQQQQVQNDHQTDIPADVSLNTSARDLISKNVLIKLQETFGDNQNKKLIANITGRYSFLKQTLAEMI